MSAVHADSVEIDVGDLVRHHRTGNYYRVVFLGRLETTLEECFGYVECTPQGYIHEPTAKAWIRPVKEMCDGRFTNMVD